MTAPATTHRIDPAPFTGQEGSDGGDEVSISLPGGVQMLFCWTKGLRSAFAVVEKKFKELDSLILQFGKTQAGKSMITTWKDARIQKGMNGDSEDKKPAEPSKPA
jgi:hypothetical protein